jgi:hypothetical protein
MPTNNRNTAGARAGELNWWILVHSYDVNGPIVRGEHFWNESTGSWVKAQRDATVYKERIDALHQSGKLAQRNILTRIVRVDRFETPVTPNTVVLDQTKHDVDPVPMIVVASKEDGTVAMNAAASDGKSMVVKFDNFVRWIRDGELRVVWDPDRREVPSTPEDYLISIGVWED